MAKTDLRVWDRGVKTALMATVLTGALALPSVGQALTCLGYTVTADLNFNATTDFADGDSDVIWGKSTGQTIKIDPCDVYCANGGSDVVNVVDESSCTYDSGVPATGEAQIEMGTSGNNDINCFDDCRVKTPGTGSNTVLNQEGAHTIVFYGGAGNDRLNLNGPIPFDSDFFFVPGTGSDTVDCNGFVEGLGGGTDDFSLSAAGVETTIDCP